VYILFATVVEKDILFALYTVPSLSICRGTQRLEGIERLGLPSNAFAQLAIHGGSVPENKTMKRRTAMLSMWDDGDEGPDQAGRPKGSRAALVWAGPPSKRTRGFGGAAWPHAGSPGRDGSDEETATDDDDEDSGDAGGATAASAGRRAALPAVGAAAAGRATLEPLPPWGHSALRSLPQWATKRLREVAERTIGATPRRTARGGDVAVATGMARSPSASFGAAIASPVATPVPPLGLAAVIALQQRELREREAASGSIISGTGCTVVQGPGRTVVAGQGCTVVAGEGCTVIASAGSTAVICAGCNVNGYGEGKTPGRGHVDANMVSCLHALSGGGVSLPNTPALVGLQTPPQARRSHGEGNPPSTGGGSVATSVPVPALSAQHSAFGEGSPIGVSTRSRRPRRASQVVAEANDSDREMEAAAGVGLSQSLFFHF
jgi:hypothetical protein